MEKRKITVDADVFLKRFRQNHNDSQEITSTAESKVQHLQANINETKETDLEIISEEIQFLMDCILPFCRTLKPASSSSCIKLRLEEIVGLLFSFNLIESQNSQWKIQQIQQIQDASTTQHYLQCLHNIILNIKWQKSLGFQQIQATSSDENSCWINRFAPVGVEVLELFAQFKDVPEVIGKGIPQLFWPSTNSWIAPFHLSFVGTSWSDNDFNTESPLKHFPWAIGLIEEFKLASESRKQELASLWLVENQKYFVTWKPCWKWFSRLLILLTYLERHWLAVNRFAQQFNFSFWDTVLLPTIPFGKIGSSVKELLFLHSMPIVAKLWGCIRQENTNSLIIWLHSRTNSGIKKSVISAKDLQELDDVKKLLEQRIEIVWEPIYSVFEVQEPVWSARSNLYAVKIKLPHRPHCADWLFVSQGFSTFGHPLLCDGRADTVAASVIKFLTSQ